MEPGDKSRLVNFTMTMVRAPKALPKLLERIRSTSPSPDLAAAIESLEQGFLEIGERFDRVEARKLGERLMKSETQGPKFSAGATLLDALDYDAS